MFQILDEKDYLNLRYKFCTIVQMKIIADTNIFLAVVLEEPEKGRIIQLTAGHELAAPEILPYEIGNALTALVKRKVLNAVGSIVPLVRQGFDHGHHPF